MPLIQQACLPTARMEMFYAAMRYPDLAVLDASMNGHALYNYGSLPWLSEQAASTEAYSVHLTEMDLAMGDMGKLRLAAEEIRDKGFRHAFLMPSAAASVLGLRPEDMCAEISESGVSFFSAPVPPDADFFEGSERLLSALACAFSQNENRMRGFCLLGGFFSDAAGHEHGRIAEHIKSVFHIPLLFDNLNPLSVTDWRRAAAAEVNILTSQSALPAARYLRERYGVPFLEWFPLGKKAQDEAMRRLADLLETAYTPECDSVYDSVVTQVKNVIAFSGKRAACYCDIDRLRRLRSLFEEMGVEAEYLCSHRNSDGLPVCLPDECIARFQTGDTLLFSYDSVCRHVHPSVRVARTGLEYALMTPLRRMQTGVEGAYRVMERLVDALCEPGG